jgi:cell wall-associated NlpC family hydrolase
LLKHLSTKTVAAIVTLSLLCALLGDVPALAADDGTNEGAGIVKVGELILRTQPGESGYKYTTARKDDCVVIIKWANDKWYEVIYKGARGFMYASYVAPTDSMLYDVGIGEVVGKDVSLRESYDASSKRLTLLDLETMVKVVGVYKKWYKVEYNGLTGYVRSDYIRIMVSDPPKQPESATPLIEADTSSSSNPKPSATPKPAAQTVSYTDSTGELSFDESTSGKLAEFALTLIGTKYVYGGSTPSGGFDCSGFVMYVYKQFDINLPHGSSSQSTKGTKIDRDSLKVGDVVFFGPGNTVNHAGIYLGDGVFVHASSAGGNVKLNNLSDSYYKTTYKSASRFL